MTDISIAIIVRNRQKALLNTLKGLTNSLSLPKEVVIVHMNEDAVPLLGYPFNIVSMQCQSHHKLHLAKARNMALQHASNEHVIFLDVDCIPDQSLVGNYCKAFQEEDLLFTGQVRYLNEGAAQKQDLYEYLVKYSEPDPIRYSFDQIPYELFWSLNFACSKNVFHKIGGFDEAFVGYGGEDTDFAFAARKAKIKLRTIAAMAYHQHHASYSPPLNHLKDIVSNAIAFKKKWNQWPMEGWLKAFQERAFIKWQGNEIRILRQPSQTEIAIALKC